ncbi:hypothetical protein AB840_01555 [Megasphaera cerevisiae DSM 20462]|jgi:hypothetical protein|uniref:Uncharacterized protein n=1 Tax=Megasphaera cerevisiae DSM 20462 TaxID=1122219 RepID=A0A0J6WYA4_9FIRM|nr:CBO2463/CBO2479 domain-containing protein [Megasphaera cerevisiae]KMO87614.1 hypothetical protein AB840_01555 [Megasphaera cerevisiae DSM 20462]OKY54676.1 hypothetical protein BSR42_01135 [Megasphaera cerevisiae]SJZ66436.1 hypothetical protein SAMN05660900_01121 [Megasphaera cerevisiae DSM 20462]
MPDLAYQLNPVLMGGVVTQSGQNIVKINLNGRLGVLYVRNSMVQGTNITPGAAVQFYFSYIQIVTEPLDYDYFPLEHESEVNPVLIGGVIIEVNDTAVKIEMGNQAGTVAVPRRWVFTSVPLAAGQQAEFYVSRIKVKHI